MAERVGFEPTVRLHVRLISSQVHSTTLPPLLCRSIYSNLKNQAFSKVFPPMYEISASGTEIEPSAF